MSYTEITFNDRNPVKRWFQRQRLSSAVKLCRQLDNPPTSICDFGAGDGELCKHLSAHFPNAGIVCYEPTANLLDEARENVSAIRNIEVAGEYRNIESHSFDVVTCLEVFEHLPPEQVVDALEKISTLLKPDGVIIIGVPVETGIPALYKGVFRMSRRYGAFDANFRNVTRALLGRPPTVRPVDEIAPGFKYHWEHMGFDIRRFKATLAGYFELDQPSASVRTRLGSIFMPEAYFVIDRTNRGFRRSL
jgi:trans-aconitate methyltransferase